MDGALGARQQTGTDLHTARPQCQRSSQPSSIGNAARSDDRHMDGIDDLRNKCHRGHLAHMAAALGTFGNNGVNAERFQMFGQNGCRHHGDDRDTGCFPRSHVPSRISRPGGDELYALLHHDFGKFIRLRVHQHDVHAKGLVGQCAAAADVFPQGVRVHAAGTDQPQRPGVGTGSGKLARGDIGHAALYNGIFCT